MDTTRPTISAPHEWSGRAQMQRRTYRAINDTGAHLLGGTAHDETPYAVLVGTIVCVGPDGLNTGIDEYLDPALDPLQKQEPTRR